MTLGTPRRPARRLGKLVLVHAALLAAAFVAVAPFLWMITSSLKPLSEIFRPPYFIPEAFHFENYLIAWEAAPFLRFYFNTAVMAVGITAGHVICDAMAAYAFARLRFRGRDVLFVGLLATMMIPSYVTLIPGFLIVSGLGWIDTYQALIVPRLADVFGIFLLRQYFLTIPRELEDAGRIDGLSRWGVLWRIVLPLSGPALAVLAVFSFLFAWNDFLWPLVVTNDPDMRTVQTGLATFQGRYGTRWNLLMAGTVIATVPALVAFLLAQRHIIKGVTLTGLKG